MSFKTFLAFIRVEAKTASVLPVLLGMFYCLYQFQTLNLLNSLVYLIAQIAIAIFVTGFNNVMDYQKAVDMRYRDQDNIIGKEKIDPKFALNLMLVFLSISIVLGCFLVYRTNLMLLPIGALGIFVAIFYTFGPIPFSRVPLGEVLSGLCESFGAFFITVYVNVDQSRLLAVDFTNTQFLIRGNYLNLLTLLLISLVIALPTAAIMLADNICDLKQDILNERYTLPYYLSKPVAIKLYVALELSALGVAVLAVLLDLLPKESLIVVGLLPFLMKNIQTFKQQQIKEVTFITAVKNSMAISSVLTLSLCVAWLRMLWLG